jgi:predicted RNase H-like HicB family nuclease
MKVSIYIEKGETSYGAWSPDVPGCYAGGQSREETIDLMKEALQEHIDYLIRNNKPLPMALRAAFMRHAWAMRWQSFLTWLRWHLPHKEEIDYITIPLSPQV